MSRAPVRLDVGNHEDPDGGGRCLMEHVSELAGEPFRAWPRCTHPAVAALATQVNDRVSAAGRAELVTRAPALTRADTDDPALTWVLVARCADAVLEYDPRNVVAARRLRRARRACRTWRVAVPPGLAGRLPRWAVIGCGLAALDELVAALHGVLAIAGPPRSAARDRVLIDLLDAAIAETTGEPELATPGPARPHEEGVA